jgi:hypothetical protein
MLFNSPPGWPQPPAGWTPPQGWKPDPSWPAPPEGWQLWIDDTPTPTFDALTTDVAEVTPPTPSPMVAEAVFESPSSVPGAPPQPVPSVEAAPVQAPPTTVDSAAMLARIRELEAALAAAQSETAGLVELSDQQVLQDVGIYRYHHPLENAAAYKERLSSLEGEMDTIIKSGRGVLAADLFTWDGSLAKGRKMVGDAAGVQRRG